ncbi:MAG: hypothetical protein IKK66_02785 [Ruminococcus sp.]|nr:hypothetical protein [Ruminococcus sp.]
MEKIDVYYEPEINDELPQEDSTEYLEYEKIRTKKEGQLEDIPAMQGILCLILAVGMVVLNMFYPDTAEDLFGMIKGYSASEEEILENPINYLIEYAENKG